MKRIASRQTRTSQELPGAQFPDAGESVILAEDAGIFYILRQVDFAGYPDATPSLRAAIAAVAENVDGMMHHDSWIEYHEIGTDEVLAHEGWAKILRKIEQEA